MTFDRGEFEHKLDRVCRLIGEVWAVDRVLDGYRGIVDGDGITLGKKDVHVGTTHHFVLFDMPETIGGSLGSSDSGTSTSTLVPSYDYLYAKGQNWAADIAAAVRAQVEDIVRPISSTFGEVSDIVSGEIGTVALHMPDDFAHIQNNLGKWSGETADAFGDWYALVEFHARTQAYVAESLSAAVSSCRTVVNLGQQSLMDLLTNSEEALDEALEKRAALQPEDPPASNSWRNWVAVGVVTLSVLAAIPTGGASVAAGAGTAAAITVGEAAISVAAAGAAAGSFALNYMPPEEGKPTTFSTTRAEDALQSLNDGLLAIGEGVRFQWTYVEELVTRQVQDATLALAQGNLFPPRPGLEPGVLPEDFHHDSVHY